MVNRIAVMSQGDMVQIATPLEIYDRPRTQFVGDFIGSPAMSMFAASLRPDGRLDCALQAFADALPAEERARGADVADAAGRLLIGIRPERMTIGPADERNGVAATIEFIEPLGQTTNVYVDAGGHRFVVVADRVSVKVGDAVSIYPTPEHLRVVASNGR